MANEMNKVPCGGFYLGDGLAMDGNTLKNLGGKQVQTDWNQNDATAKDYIKNRPGGYEEGFDITWDGDTTGRVSATREDDEGFALYLYKVSDEILTADQIIGATITQVRHGVTQQIVITGENISEEEFGYFTSGSLIATKQGTFNTQDANISIPEPGIYFMSAGGSEISSFVSSLSNITVHPFDDKCIPNTIARKAELDSRITEKEVILASSTTDSTKKFRITVDDTGTIKATEVANN